MDSQDHKITATSTGHEGHGVHLCHRCGWPFPNPHPSAKHRRAHKKVCGTIEGYKIIHSEEHDEHHLAVSDDEQASDGDEHTPLPTLAKKKSEEFSSSSDGVFERSTKSEDDVFADAATDFSDSGISPRLEERFESVRGPDESVKQKKRVEVDEAADRTVKINYPTESEKKNNPVAPVNADDQSESLIPITAPIVGAASTEPINGLKPDLIKSENPREVDIVREEDKSASVTLDSEEGKISDSPLSDVEKKEDSRDVLVSKVVRDDIPPQNQALQKSLDASEGVKSVALSSETNNDTKNVGEIALAEATPGNKDASVGSAGAVGENTLPEESLLSTPSVDKEVEQKTNSVGGEGAHNLGASEGEKCETGAHENQESKENFSAKTVSADNPCATQDDQTTRALEKDGHHCEENSNSNAHAETKTVKGEEQALLDSKAPSENSVDFPSSCEADSDAKSVEKLSKTDSNSLQTRDNGSAGVDAKVNHDIGDVSDRNCPPTAALEDPISRVISESPNNIHVTSTDGVESVDVAGKVAGVKEDSKVIVSERTPEQPILESSVKMLAELNRDGNALILSENSDEKCMNETSPDVEEICSSKDVSASKFVHVVPSEDVNIVTSEKCLNETSATYDDKNIVDVENVTGIDSKSLQDEIDEQKDTVSVTALSGSSISRSVSLEGNCGSVSDTVETNSQKQKSSTGDKSDDFEPPSFMTLVQSGGEGDVPVAPEIETVHANQQQQPKSDALQAGWFPSLTNVVNESEGRKKNEEMIAKVTNWSPVKQHSPLKNLLNEVKSPNTKQVPAEAQTGENEAKDNGAPASKIQGDNTNKEMEEWNSPARYPIEVKKEKKKKGKSYWVPFVCCSSVHRDL